MPIGSWLTTNFVGLFALPSGLWAVWTWHRDQRWKRIAAAFERVASFDATPGTRNAMMILKSRSRPIPLYDASAPLDQRYVEVTWEDAKWALVPTIYNLDASPMTNALRDCFEDFMNRMSQIEMYVAARCLTVDEVRYLVEPWVRRLDGSVNDGGVTRNFRVYVWHEHKTAVVRLFRRFGNDFIVSDAEWESFKIELKGGRSSKQRPTDLYQTLPDLTDATFPKPISLARDYRSVKPL